MKKNNGNRSEYQYFVYFVYIIIVTYYSQVRITKKLPTRKLLIYND
ncbi:hypothetical protein JCM14244_17150 [Venenivibrio stagnispumantis]